MAKPTVSIIVTTYNWPQALAFVLASLNHQNDDAFEVIVADDGSNESTTQLLAQLKVALNYPLSHIWQPDQGFRAARARNLALLYAKNDYIVFIDGDCAVLPDFVHNHKRLSETGYFVSGQRVLISSQLTAKLLSEGFQPHMAIRRYWFKHRLNGDCNKVMPLLNFPLGLIRKFGAHKWQGVQTCNLGVWRQDLMAVNGFEEQFVGWGYEDSDLVARLLHCGVKRKQGRMAVPVLHLWHKASARGQAITNWQIFQQRLHCQQIQAVQGLNQYR
jgi:glycosyltransferase involved in cell wall biosynthesis